MLPKFSSRAFLAPMAGVSDPALRLQCKKMGAGLVVTEFTNIHSIIAKEKQLKDHMKTITEFIEYSEQERPLSVQLFGSDLDALEKAAKIVEPYFDIIDYNKKILNINSNKLTTPHPKMTKRNFVLLPLFEIDRDWKHPESKINIVNLINSLPIKDLRSIKQI